MSVPTGFLLHPASALHDTGWGHPEHQGRLRSLSSTVGRDMLALHGRVEQMQPVEASEEDLLRVHTPEHVESIRTAVAAATEKGSPLALDADTLVSDASWDAALGSVGAAIAAADAVARGERHNAFVATRPPGHHATPNRAMGFCLFNTVAVTARWLQAQKLAERVLIVDWDVHHGNGTQDVFWEDPTVGFLSLHQSPLWPGTGAADERGAGAGEGATWNVELPAGTDGAAYRERFVAAVDRAVSVIDPDFVLVSAGFDALAGDPIGGLALEPEDFHLLTEELIGRTSVRGDSRLVALLEGGYDPRRTGLAAVAVLRAMAGVRPADPTLPATAG
jgi:acetoin utilization deacetylase AcuC-like enzyme